MPNSMPQVVMEYMEQNVTERFAPVCLSFDADLKLTHWSGELESYDFPNLSRGLPVDRFVPVVAGVEESDLPLRFSMVEIVNGVIVHVHLIRREEGGVHVLLFDASREHKNQQVYQQKANEVQLLNEQLTKVLKQLERTQAELKVKKQEAEQASELKSQFIANMSHEFRTPLTSIIGYTEMWQKKLLKPEQVNDAVASVANGAKFLLSLIENVLDQARFEAGEMELQSKATNLVDLMQETAGLFEPLAKRKQLDFELIQGDMSNAWYELDAMRLRQLVINLVNNAIKYTDEGKITVHYFVCEGCLRIRVSDTGMGIDEKQQEEIFNPFHRVSSSREKEGAGLGLAISRQILDLMGGGLTLQSEIGKGSEFEICLPVEPSNCGCEPNSIVPNHNGAKTILVAEDNPDIVDVIELFLVNAEFNVLRAKTGEEAIQMILQYRPDLVLMDINMPKVDGLKATARVRAEGYTQPILALSAASSGQDQALALDAGCNSFLLKPIAMDDLITSVNHYLSI